MFVIICKVARHWIIKIKIQNLNADTEFFLEILNAETNFEFTLMISKNNLSKFAITSSDI